jgi:hypothetical protein
MIPPFDIFLVASDGHLTWKAAAEVLETAKRRSKLLMGVDPGNYVIYGQKTGHKTLIRSEKPT